MIPYSTQCIDEDDIRAVVSALKSDFITQGSKVDEFERKIADFVGAKYAVSFNSATSALNVAYKIIKCDLANRGEFQAKNGAIHANLCESQSKIEFLTTPLTFCATANMMVENGITPRFCDIDCLGNIDINKLRLSPNTRAIVSVDYAGNSVEAEKIAQICKENNLYFISDSSHSFGGALNGRKIGTFADMSIFSFHAVKPITTIEGGAITTNNERFYHIAKLLRSHCIEKTELWDSEIVSPLVIAREQGNRSNPNCPLRHSELSQESEESTNHKMNVLDSSLHAMRSAQNDEYFIGHNFRLSDVAASLGISQLNKLESFLDSRTKIARLYDSAFKGESKFRTLKIPQNIKPTYHLYPILLDSALFKHKKAIFRALLEANLGVQVHYKPLYKFAPYKNHAPLPSVEHFYNAEISIPCHQKMSENDADFVISTLQNVLKNF